MKTAWDVTKEYFTKDSTPGTFGETRQIHDAALLFTQLLSFFEDEEAEKEAFNADKQVLDSLMHHKIIKEIKDSGII